MDCQTLTAYKLGLGKLLIIHTINSLQHYKQLTDRDDLLAE